MTTTPPPAIVFISRDVTHGDDSDAVQEGGEESARERSNVVTMSTTTKSFNLSVILCFVQYLLSVTEVKRVKL